MAVSAPPPLPTLGAVDDGSHFTMIGNSNCVTFNATPALSTVVEGANERVTGTSFAALVETTVESPLSGWLNTMRAICGGGRDFIGSEHCTSSASLNDVDPGSATYAEWATQITDANIGRDVNPYRAKAQLVILGDVEELEESGEEQTFAENLRALRLAQEAHVQDVSGQSESYDFFIGYQTPSGAETSTDDYKPCLTCQQVLDLTNTVDRNRAFLVGPAYQYPIQNSGNDTHLTNVGARRLGNLAGYVACEVYGTEVAWKTLQITSAVQTGSSIELTYHNPTGTTLVYDTTLVAAKEIPGNGFTMVCDDRVDNPTIIGTPTIVDADTVTLALTQPADVGCVPAYAYNNGRDDVGAADATSLGGNLRDSNTVVRNSENLYNWASSQKASSLTGGVAKSTPDGTLAQRTHTWAIDFRDCQTSPNWTWLNPYKEIANVEATHADALTPMQLLLDATDTTYTCGKSTGTLTGATIGTSRLNTGMVLAGTGCFRDATGLAAVQPLPDGSDALLTALLEIDGTAGTQYFMIWNSAAGEYITLQYSSTTITTRWRSSEGVEISRAVSSVPTNTLLFFQAHYISDCDGGGAGTNPCVDTYLNGTRSAGSAHSVNFGQINAPLVGVGFGCDQAGGSNFNGSMLWFSLDFGSDASWFAGESTHDADYAAECTSPPCAL